MKAIKQHIINDKNSFCCGLKRNNSNIKTAFFEDDILYDNECNPVTFESMNNICRNCLKLSHPTLFNDLLNEKAIIDYRNSLPKSNRERMKRKQVNRMKRNESFNRKHNVIYFSYFSKVDLNITVSPLVFSRFINTNTFWII